MKVNLGKRVLGITLMTALMGLAPAAQAHNQTCSQAGVAGEWGYTYTGSILLPTGAIPAAAVGSFSLDAQRNISGSQTRSVVSSVAQETINGTGTVNQDCTVTYKIDVYDGAGNLLRTAELAGVFVDKERELRAIFASLVLPNGASLPPVITINAKKIFHQDED
jgi:hypothetical protein